MTNAIGTAKFPMDILLALSLAFLLGCSPRGKPLTTADFVGVYGQNIEPIWSLELSADGKYECSIRPPVVGDPSCFTFVRGAAVSRGTWLFENRTVKFFPTDEEPGILFSLKGATAAPIPVGIHLAVGEMKYVVRRDPRSRAKPDQSTQASSSSGRR